MVSGPSGNAAKTKLSRRSEDLVGRRDDLVPTGLQMRKNVEAAGFRVTPMKFTVLLVHVVFFEGRRALQFCSGGLFKVRHWWRSRFAQDLMPEFSCSAWTPNIFAWLFL